MEVPMVRKSVSALLFAILAIGLFGTACTKKQKSYTLENVNEELLSRQKEIVALRKKGKLEKSANLALKAAGDILNVYPMATMYRENVSRVVSVMGFLARLCNDKALHIRNESMNPEDSKKYNKLSDDLYSMIDDIRRKMPGMPSNKKPEIKKVTPETGDDGETPEARTLVEAHADALQSAGQRAPEDRREGEFGEAV
ncbi:MAG: hypothetical protein CVU65_14100, partial [Deltaproteobacteria bacterium HGW-Deltaproteobacteria-22]